MRTLAAAEAEQHHDGAFQPGGLGALHRGGHAGGIALQNALWVREPSIGVTGKLISRMSLIEPKSS